MVRGDGNPMTNHDLCTDVQLQDGLRNAIHSSLKSLTLPEGLDASSLAEFLVSPVGSNSPDVDPLALASYLEFMRGAVSAAVLVTLAYIDQTGHNPFDRAISGIESLLSVFALMRTAPAEAGEVMQ
jgi:hypothetical protein